MKDYFEAKLKHVKIDDNGRERKVTETFILEAVSFTDAEAKMTEYGQQICKGGFEVKNIKESQVEKILDTEGEYAWKARISSIMIDMDLGREKRFNSHWLAWADSLADALKKMQSEIDQLVVPANVESIAISPVISDLLDM